jgi:hypothetical protein
LDETRYKLAETHYHAARSPRKSGRSL